MTSSPLIGINKVKRPIDAHVALPWLLLLAATAPDAPTVLGTIIIMRAESVRGRSPERVSNSLRRVCETLIKELEAQRTEENT